MAALQRSRRTRSWRKKLLFALITTAGFFLLMEACLALLGVGPVTDTRDPFVGFSNHIPLLEESEDEAGEPLMSTAPNKLVWFNAQTFAKRKPAGTYRIFCLGGSTTYGRPYWDATSYSGWLRELLPVVDDSRQWEVINVGGISYASYRVANVMQELTQYEPDLFVVYSAHNEFLERRTYADMFVGSGLQRRAASALHNTRTWAMLDRLIGQTPSAPASSPSDILPGEVDEILNHTIGPADYHRDDDWRNRVLHHYESNLLRMITLARQAGAEIVFITPASNEKDCSPFKSEFRLDISDHDVGRFWSHFEQADRALAAGQLERALTSFQAARTIEDDYAHLHFRIGQVLSQLSRADEARAAFERALNEDICPLRAVDEISESLQRVTRLRSVPLVDFEQKLRAKSKRDLGQGSLGHEYFLDHVHPTVDVHQQLAIWIITDLQAYGLVGGHALDESQREEVSQRVLAQIDPQAQGIALRNLAKVFHWAGKFDEAAPMARSALELIEDDPESLFVLARCLRRTGHTEEAVSRFKRLLAVAPTFSAAYVPCGCLLAEQGELNDAKFYLAMGVFVQPESFDGQYTLGVVHIQLSEFELAIPALEEADKLLPNDTSTMLLLARAKAETGATEEAISLFEHVLDMNGDDSHAHNYLGQTLLRQQRTAEAIRHFEAAIMADPSYEAARLNLEAARGNGSQRAPSR